jgi:hypothetical protein
MNVTTMSSWQDGDELKALTDCYRHGWLHADLISANEVDEDVGYVFASPLHRWYVERKLHVTNHTTPSHANVFEFSRKVIRLYDPSNLCKERKVGPGAIQKSPEAQFQDEFYRCSHLVSRGAIITFPEFGIRGWVDFYIPSRKWGVELLRDGYDLVGHRGRFTGSGLYTELDIDEYVVLDFRARRVRDSHSRMFIVPLDDILLISFYHSDFKNLYHVVFSQDFREVKILNNKLDVVDEFRLLNSK